MLSGQRESTGSMSGIALLVGLILLILLSGIIFVTVYDAWYPSYPNTLKLAFAGNSSVSGDQLSATVATLNGRFDALGLDASITTSADITGRTLIGVHYRDIPARLVETVATTPGHFEINIQGAGNLSDFVLNGSDIKSASRPIPLGQINGSATYGVSIVMTPAGAELFRQSCIAHNATLDPENHQIITLIDGTTVDMSPLSSQLAGEIAARPVDTLMIETGTGDAGYSLAEMLTVSLSGGELPVPLKVVST